MNPAEFNAALGGLINSAASQGVPLGHVVLTLELMKADLIRQMQDQARAQQGKIIPVRRLPPNGLTGESRG